MSNLIDQHLPVAMVRPTLADIPNWPLPAPYGWRWYQPGDEAHWVAIHVAADPHHTHTVARFWEIFGSGGDVEGGGLTAVLAQRQLYLLDPDGQPVGTASAWFDDPDTGRVHWVAIQPQHQGRGLAKPLLSQICLRLRALGHKTAHLLTSTGRLPAINLYRRFGFVPHIREEKERAVWEALTPHLL